MSVASITAQDIQRDYYSRTANLYDEAHVEREHVVALHLLAAFIEFSGITSVLDVGAGTGRAMRFLRNRFPQLIVKGIEPVAELREIAYRSGIPESDLIDGDGTALPFTDASFDLVCEFAVLHHVRRPEQVVEEMNRTAGKAVAISDANFMGQGHPFVRVLKWWLFHCRLWGLANYVKTKGKGYTISDGDGLAYSYTVYQNLSQLQRRWKRVNIVSTAGNADNPRGLETSATHLLLVGWNGHG